MNPSVCSRVYSIVRRQGDWVLKRLPTWQSPSREVIVSHPSPWKIKHKIVFHLLQADCFTSLALGDSFRWQLRNSLYPQERLSTHLPMNNSICFKWSRGDWMTRFKLTCCWRGGNVPISSWIVSPSIIWTDPKCRTIQSVEAWLCLVYLYWHDSILWIIQHAYFIYDLIQSQKVFLA